MRYCITTLPAKYHVQQSRAFASLAQASGRAVWTVAQSFVPHEVKSVSHSPTSSIAKSRCPTANTRKPSHATANLTRAVEVAEELLQAIKQATPTPTGKQSVLEPPLFHGGLAYQVCRQITKKKKKKKIAACPGPPPPPPQKKKKKKKKKNSPASPVSPSTPNQP